MQTNSSDVSFDTDPLIESNPIKRIIHRIAKFNGPVILIGCLLSATVIYLGIRSMNDNTSSNIPSIPHTTSFGSSPTVSYELHDTIQHSNLYHRLIDLQSIADLSTPSYNHSTRVIGSIGFEKTIEYIRNELSQYDNYYTISLQYFPVNYYIKSNAHITLNIPSKNSINNINTVKLREHIDYSLMKMSPTTDITASTIGVSNYGCDPNDYITNVNNNNIHYSTQAELPVDDVSINTQLNGVSGKIVIIKRGQCTFEQKIDLAGTHGAVAVIMYNHGEDNEHQELFGGDISTMKQIPTYAVTYNIGELLINLLPSVTLQCTSTMNNQCAHVVLLYLYC